MYFFLFNRTTLQVFVIYLAGTLYVHPLWFYKHQHDNRVRSKRFVACQWWWFQWWFWFVPSVPDTHAPCRLKLCIPPSNGIVRLWLFPEFGAELPLDNCTPTVILNNPVNRCCVFVGNVWNTSFKRGLNYRVYYVTAGGTHNYQCILKYYDTDGNCGNFVSLLELSRSSIFV